MNDDDFRGEEIITVKMPRKDFQTMQKLVAERQAYDTVTAKLKSWWVWIVVGGVLSIFSFWDALKIKVGS